MYNLHIVTLALLCLTSLCNLSVDPLTSYLTDDNGRFMFFHGVNAVYKEFPYYPTTDVFNSNTSLSKQDFMRLREWGFKAIRLNVAWVGFQPKQGQYNYSYLEQVKKIVRQAQKYDISILLDAHQDLYSRRFCGQGFPDWIVTRLTFPAPLKVDLRFDSNGNPLKQDCMKISFQKYYKSQDVNRFSHDFFTNKNDMATKFTKMWLNVVGYFKGQSNVLGYDLINQPSAANIYNNPYDAWPAVDNNKYLLPFYKNLSKAIRQLDTQKLIFFQPSLLGGGFLGNPSGPKFANKDVISYHTYCPYKNQHNQPTSKFKCKIVDTIRTLYRNANIKKLKVGSVMTQFGGVPNSNIGRQEINRIVGIADQNWQSWFWWQYKYYADYTTLTSPAWQQSLFNLDGTLQYQKVQALSYPYAYAVCGTPLTQSHLIGTYTFSFVPKLCNGAYTQIYLNQDMYFKNGFTISFNPTCKDCVLQSTKKNYYKLIVSQNALHKKLQLRVAGFI